MAATGRRYAQAAFELAREHNNLHTWEYRKASFRCRSDGKKHGEPDDGEP